jgi:hypothetical protein
VVADIVDGLPHGQVWRPSPPALDDVANCHHCHILIFMLPLPVGCCFGRQMKYLLPPSYNNANGSGDGGNGSNEDNNNGGSGNKMISLRELSSKLIRDIFMPKKPQ